MLCKYYYGFILLLNSLHVVQIIITVLDFKRIVSVYYNSQKTYFNNKKKNKNEKRS